MFPHRDHPHIPPEVNVTVWQELWVQITLSDFEDDEVTAVKVRLPYTPHSWTQHRPSVLRYTLAPLTVLGGQPLNLHHHITVIFLLAKDLCFGSVNMKLWAPEKPGWSFRRSKRRVHVRSMYSVRKRRKVATRRSLSLTSEHQNFMCSKPPTHNYECSLLVSNYTCSPAFIPENHCSPSSFQHPSLFSLPQVPFLSFPPIPLPGPSTFLVIFLKTTLKKEMGEEESVTQRDEHLPPPYGLR